MYFILSVTHRTVQCYDLQSHIEYSEVIACTVNQSDTVQCNARTCCLTLNSHNLLAGVFMSDYTYPSLRHTFDPMLKLPLKLIPAPRSLTSSPPSFAFRQSTSHAIWKAPLFLPHAKVADSKTLSVLAFCCQYYYFPQVRHIQYNTML